MVFMNIYINLHFMPASTQPCEWCVRAGVGERRGWERRGRRKRGWNAAREAGGEKGRERGLEFYSGDEGGTDDEKLG